MAKLSSILGFGLSLGFFIIGIVAFVLAEDGSNFWLIPGIGFFGAAAVLCAFTILRRRRAHKRREQMLAHAPRVEPPPSMYPSPQQAAPSMPGGTGNNNGNGGTVVQGPGITTSVQGQFWPNVQVSPVPPQPGQGWNVVQQPGPNIQNPNIGSIQPVGTYPTFQGPTQVLTPMGTVTYSPMVQSTPTPSISTNTNTVPSHVYVSSPITNPMPPSPHPPHSTPSTLPSTQ